MEYDLVMDKVSVDINELSLRTDGNRQILSAKVDGEIVWFDFPANIELERRGELFITVALLEAMISNLPIVLSDDIVLSPLLLEKIEQLQSIYRCWNPDLHKISVQGGNLVSSSSNNKVASFYSGGVDGAYSLCKHKDELSALITLSGFDTINKTEQWPLLVEKNKKLANKFNVELIDVKNNIRQFTKKRKISNNFQHGLTLAGIAVTLGFKKVFIPSSFTYDDLFPWGSHPVSDPLWSIEYRKVLHDGADVSRSEKIKFIADYPEVLNNLQVCWNNIAYNCGRCSKCLRTQAALDIFGLHSSGLTPLKDISELKTLSITGQAGLPFIKDLMKYAHLAGKTEIEGVFKRLIFRFTIKYYFEGLIRTLLGKKFKTFVHKVRGTRWHKYRVTLGGKDNS
jgi:hypothetical protein